MIDDCGFGSIVIQGRKFGSDLIIHPDGRVQEGWRRARGHRLAVADIEPLIESGPEIIVAGTGVFGRMRPEKELVALLQQRGIEFVAAANKKAMARFNAAKQAGRKVGGCFHLTC